LLLAASTAVFVITTPYALLDYSTFLKHVAREVHHYATGHGGVKTTPGWPMFARHAASFIDDWGPVLTAFALWGSLLLARKDFRLFLIVFSFPILFVAYMSSQRVFFSRNVVAVHLFIALGITVTLLELPKLATRVLLRLARFDPGSRRTRLVRGLAIATIILASLPWSSVFAAYRSDVSSRRAAERWVMSNVHQGTTLLVDEQLRLDTRQLERKYRIVPFSSRNDTEKGGAGRRLRRAQHSAVAIVAESKRPFYEQLTQGGTVLAGFGTERVPLPKAASMNDPKLLVLRVR
jgi:hypothetical protein